MSRLDSLTSGSILHESSRRTQLLVSVRDAHEAQIALEGGVDWIDLKEPTHGALGAVALATAREVVKLVDGRVPVSAAGGELLDWPDSPAEQLIEVPGLELVKLGLAGCSAVADWREKWLKVAQRITSAGKQPVAVCYADHTAARSPAPGDVLALASEFSAKTILIDTYDKSSGPLSVHLSRSALAHLLQDAKRCGMRTVVAGKLRIEDVPQLPLELIDLVAVRGAVCRENRSGLIDAGKIDELAAALQRETLSNCEAKNRDKAEFS